MRVQVGDFGQGPAEGNLRQDSETPWFTDQDLNTNLIFLLFLPWSSRVAQSSLSCLGGPSRTQPYYLLGLLPMAASAPSVKRFKSFASSLSLVTSPLSLLTCSCSHFSSVLLHIVTGLTGLRMAQMPFVASAACFIQGGPHVHRVDTAVHIQLDGRAISCVCVGFIPNSDFARFHTFPEGYLDRDHVCTCEF